ncbi:MAG: SPOR domain-containing protein [Bacteroidales bacterium]|nr:SPOR domain-containing protein [Bacteroidales bacterium]MDD4672330.1 SPOR domain-containing protein [Bacteroidales bacterium]MDY0349181.1 SPOR domain-containing protein [Tenuifilaceae bacterium]
MKTQFLRELIETSARVILPDFGAFLVKDDGSGVFKPENITFSPFLRYNDGMVEDALASNQKVSKDKAKEALTKYIEELKAELNSKKFFVISGLGSLYMDKRGSIQFSTDETLPSKATPTPDTHSRSPEKKKDTEVTDTKKSKTASPTEKTKEEPLELDIKDEKEPLPQPKKIVRAEKETPPLKNEPTPPQNVKKAEEVKKEAPKVSKIESKPSQNSKKPSKKGGTGKAILYGMLIGIAFVAILATGWYLYSNGVFSKNDKAVKIPKQRTEIIAEMDTPMEDEAKFDDEFEKLSAEMDVGISMDNDESETIPADENLLVEPLTEEQQVATPVQSDGMFHLIVGSFRNANYAQKYSDDMISLGYNSKVILQPTGMHAVSLGSFMSRQQAVDSMNVWKQDLPNIWILQQ